MPRRCQGMRKLRWIGMIAFENLTAGLLEQILAASGRLVRGVPGYGGRDVGWLCPWQGISGHWMRPLRQTRDHGKLTSRHRRNDFPGRRKRLRRLPKFSTWLPFAAACAKQSSPGGLFKRRQTRRRSAIVDGIFGDFGTVSRPTEVGKRWLHLWPPCEAFEWRGRGKVESGTAARHQIAD